MIIIGYRDVKFPKETLFLVTGGAGFIGSNLAEAILKSGYHLRILDNFATGKKENIEQLKNFGNFEFIEGDIRDEDTCKRACQDVTYVLHQAALGSVPRSVNDPKTTNDVNIGGTLNMLIAARDCHVKRFVYASSSSVYGDEPQLPKKEGREGWPLSPYAASKRTGEMYARNFYKLFGLETVGLRYFNVFGKRQDPNSTYSAAIPKFIRLLLQGETPVIYGDGSQSRDFTYIENVIEANLKACLASQEANGEAFNIAYGERIELLTVYEKLSQLLSKNIPPQLVTERPGDVKHSFADISKARQILGYNPDYNFQRGIEATITWYQETLSFYTHI